MVTNQLQVRCRPGKVRRSETDVYHWARPLTRQYTSNCSLCLIVPCIYIFRSDRRALVIHSNYESAGGEVRGRGDLRRGLGSDATSRDDPLEPSSRRRSTALELMASFWEQRRRAEMKFTRNTSPPCDGLLARYTSRPIYCIRINYASK